MSWLKVDDKFIRHPKVAQAAKALRDRYRGRIVAVWVEAALYSCEYGLDGLVPMMALDDFLTDRNPRQVMDALIAAKLVTVHGEAYQFHDWHEYNPPVKNVPQTLEAKRRHIYQVPGLVRHVQGRDHQRCRFCGRLVAWKDRRSEQGGTYELVDPVGTVQPDNVVVCCRGCQGRHDAEPGSDLLTLLLPPGSTDEPKNLLTDQAGDLDASQIETRSVLVSEQITSRSFLVSRVRTRARDPVPSRPVPRSERAEGQRANETSRAKPARMTLQPPNPFEAVISHLHAAVHACVKAGGRFLNADGTPNRGEIGEEVRIVASRFLRVEARSYDGRRIAAVVDGALNRSSQQDKADRARARFNERERRELRRARGGR